MKIVKFEGATMRDAIAKVKAELGDQAPAYVIRNASTWEDLRLVLPAARAFAGVLR